MPFVDSTKLPAKEVLLLLLVVTAVTVLLLLLTLTLAVTVEGVEVCDEVTDQELCFVVGGVGVGVVVDRGDFTVATLLFDIDCCFLLLAVVVVVVVVVDKVIVADVPMKGAEFTTELNNSFISREKKVNFEAIDFYLQKKTFQTFNPEEAD